MKNVLQTNRKLYGEHTSMALMYRHVGREQTALQA